MEKTVKVVSFYIIHLFVKLEVAKCADICPGIEQAEFTGQRLAKLDFPYTKIIHSTMTRARQTADIIHKSLPNLPMTESDLLQEGAPYPPEPPLRRWRPDYKV